MILWQGWPSWPRNHEKGVVQEAFVGTSAKKAITCDDILTNLDVPTSVCMKVIGPRKMMVEKKKWQVLFEWNPIFDIQDYMYF